MKTAFGCLKARLRAASFILLYIHLLVFGWAMVETLALPMPRFVFWIMLVVVSVFSAVIVFVHTETYTAASLTTAGLILFVIAIILIIFITLANVVMIAVVMAMAEFKNWYKLALEDDTISRKYSVYNVQILRTRQYPTDSAQLSWMRQFHLQLEQSVENKNVGMFVIDIIALFIIAFYLYSASVLKRYKAEVKLQSQPPAMFAPAPVSPASASYVVRPQVASYPRAADMNRVELGFGTHSQKY